MTKKKTFIIVLILCLVGSIVNFYATNLLLSDIGNHATGAGNINILATFPMYMVALELIAVLFLVVKLYRHPKMHKALLKKYLILMIVFSGIGLVTSILSGVLVYHSFVKPYPFPGYVIIGIIFHLLIIGSSIFYLVKYVKKMDTDTEKHQVTFFSVIHFILSSIFVYFAFNRFGAFIWIPEYIQWSYLDLSFVFYLSILMPIILLTYKMLTYENIIKKKKTRIICSTSIWVVSLILNIIVLCLGYNNPLFVQMISPVLGLERLATKPIITIFTTCFMFVFGLGFLIQDLKLKEK